MSRHGDDRRDVFDEVIRSTEEELARYFRRRLDNPADAAEAFGELLLVAWRYRRRIPEPPEQARMWLFGAARNVLRSSRRKLARRSAAVQRYVEEMRSTTLASDVIDDDVHAIRVAITELSEEDAELVRLIYWDGFRSHEAALVLGIPASTARSRLSKARDRLRAIMEIPDEEEENRHTLIDSLS